MESGNSTYAMIAIIIYFIAMLGIGYYAFRRTKSSEGYLLAERGLRPSVAALSANASDMSGWLMLGLPGAIYFAGISQAWIAVGLVVGCYLNWLLVAPRLRAYTQVSNNSITIPSFFHNRLKGSSVGKPLRIFSALVILVFFTFYVSSGMVASGLFFKSTFGWDYFWGMLLVSGITLLYTLFGGFLGATLTDVVQGLLMMAALVAVPLVAVTQMDGNALEQAQIINPEALNWFADFDKSGAGIGVLLILSSLAWGLGYMGQPHVIVRFMALRSPADATAGRRISTTWMAICMFSTCFAALIGIALFSRFYDREPLGEKASETVFLKMSEIFLHPLVAGFVLAAVLAAIMSTMSSQLVVTSSALVEDLFKLAGKQATDKQYLNLGRISVLLVTVVALLLALDSNSTVLSLVAFAWAGFGAAFGPVILYSLYSKRFTGQAALAGVLTGAIVVAVWRVLAKSDWAPVWLASTYEMIPGFVLSLLAIVITTKVTAHNSSEIEAEFEEMETLAKAK